MIDARIPNACHRRPPQTKLGGAGGLCELEVDFEAADFGNTDYGYGGSASVPAELVGDIGDVADAYYQCSVDNLAERFGLDDPVKAAEVEVNSI